MTHFLASIRVFTSTSAPVRIHGRSTAHILKATAIGPKVAPRTGKKNDANHQGLQLKGTGVNARNQTNHFHLGNLLEVTIFVFDRMSVLRVGG